MPSEFEWIASLQKLSMSSGSKVLLGIGDDCSILKKDDHSVYLVSTDCLVEGIHFSFDYFSHQDLGHKSLAVNLSDIAAMCGKPVCFFVSLAVPKYTPTSQINEFYKGMASLADAYDCQLAGGDTSSSLSGWFVNITVIGEASNESYKCRNGAKPGDVIAVTGNFGASCLGLHCLQKNGAVDNYFTQRHKRPHPQLLAAGLFASHTEVHAVIDVSDGLAQDLGHIVEASHVNAEILAADIPVHSELIQQSRELNLNEVETILTGGEDYELAVCLSEKAFLNLETAFKEIGVAFTSIGKITQSTNHEISKLKIYDSNHNEISLKSAGFDHFKS